MALEIFNLFRWKKLSKEGLPIPCRCPICNSRKTVLTTYADGSKAVECEGCNNVLHEYPRRWRQFVRLTA